LDSSEDAGNPGGQEMNTDTKISWALVVVVAFMAAFSFGAFFARAQDTQKAPDIAAMKLDFERFRRVWYSVNSQFMGSLSQQQRDWMEQMNSIDSQLKLKKDALVKALNCGTDTVFNDDLLTCDRKPSDVK
jgi:hypothetical protein